MFKPWELAAIDQAGYNGIRQNHIERLANSLRSTNCSEIDRTIFEYQCYINGIDPNNFTQADLDNLRKMLE